MRDDDAVLGHALPLDRGLGPPSSDALYVHIIKQWLMVQAN